MPKRLEGLTDAEEVGGSYQCLRGRRVLRMLKRLEGLPMLKMLKGLTDALEVGGSYLCFRDWRGLPMVKRVEGLNDA